MLYRKKTFVACSIIAGLTALMFLQSSAPPPINPDSFAQYPPVARQYWVQKLSSPTADYNMIMKIRFAPDDRLSSDMEVFYVDDVSVIFHDDGIAPDVTAGDGIYSAYVKENIGNFLSKVDLMQSNLQTQVDDYGGFIHFTGHVAEMITKPPSFNFIKFNNYKEVELDALLLDAADCEQDILKQNSLFITDLAVVEDPVRTNNVVTRQGNDEGAWTFGNLIKNMANQPATGVSARTLLREWLSGWTDGRTINGISVPARDRVFGLLIIPWLMKANGWTTNPYNSLTSSQLQTQWKLDWDATREDSLLFNAPFKLMAIVNRIDLRENASFKQYTYGTMLNSGETRFIYTLIAPLDIGPGALGHALAGQPPAGIPGETAEENPIDWKGMNVILEYGNPQATRCELREFAQKWLDLSAYELGSPDYNDALEDITHTVIDAGAAPGKPNGSALNQLRTNERIFFPSLAGTGASSVNVTSWKNADWQLSQFELDNTSHLLKPAPVTNVPELNSNQAVLIQGANITNQGTAPGANALIDWVFKNKYQINAGRHQLSAWSFGSSSFAQAPVADIDAEQVHYWDLLWDAATTYYTTISPSDPNPHPFERSVRQQLSLNTCQGCHAGEAKTEFTQIRPVGYGESQDYWSAIPANDYTSIDTRFVENTGTSYLNGTVEDNHKLPNTHTSEYHQRLSPFLTGRRYSGQGSWQDDDNSFADNAKDNADINIVPAILFQIFDPSNSHNGTYDDSRPKPQRFQGYNDLQRRKKDLCELLNSPCNMEEVGTVVVEIVKATSANTFPKSAH